MGRCVYCGQDAGFLKDRHRECGARHEKAWQTMLSIARTAVVKGTDCTTAKDALARAAEFGYMPASKLREALIMGWEQVADEAVADKVLSVDEQQRLAAFARRFGFSDSELDAHGGWTRIVMGAALRDVLEGKIPQRLTVSGNLPFNLQKSESLVWVFRGVDYYEMRTRTVYIGGSQGMSFRVAKGMYYRVGAFAAEPITRENSVHIDTGLLGVTTRHIYFAGGRKGFRVPYRKIATFTPYSDGIGFVRDAASAKPQVFVTGEGWFAYNLVRNLALGQS